MKLFSPAFLCAILLLSVLFLFTGVNAAVVCRRCEEIGEQSAALTAETLTKQEEKEALKTVIRRWREVRPYLSLTVSGTDLAAVDAALERAVQQQREDPALFEEAMVAMQAALQEILSKEGFSLQGLL